MMQNLKKRFPAYLAVALIALLVACNDDEENPCFTVGTDCYCQLNPTDEACFETCAQPDLASLTSLSVVPTTGESLALAVGDNLGEFFGRFIIDQGSTIEDFYFESGNSRWGISSATRTEGELVLSTIGAECGLGNEIIPAPVNRNDQAIVNIVANVNSLTYAVTYEDRDPCVDLDLENNSFFIKGAFRAPIIEAGMIVSTDSAMSWANNVSGIPLEAHPDADSAAAGWLIATADNFESWMLTNPTWARSSFKVVFNPIGDYGPSAFSNNDGIGVEFAVQPDSLDDTSNQAASGFLEVKSFEAQANGDECGFTCSEGYLDETNPNCLFYSLDDVQAPAPEGTPGAVPYTVKFNYLTREYIVQF